MFLAMSSAGWPAGMRETPPFTTLLTYLVPSGMMTSPSLPACAAFSVFSSLPSGENEHLVVADVHDDDVVLRVEGDAVRLTKRRAPWTKIVAVPSGAIFQTCHDAGSGLSPPTPVTVA